MPSYENKDKERTTRSAARPTANRSEQMDEYEKQKKELKELLAKKRVLDRNLNNLEEEIYKQEAVYLDETPNGNVVKGFDNYIKSNPNKRRMTFTEQDRVFSLSSAVFLKTKMKEEELV